MLRIEWAGFALVLLACSLQFHLTLSIWNNPIRVSLADLVSIALALIVLLSRAWAPLPAWRIRGIWFWLAGMTLVMTGALLVGRLHTGMWFPWAVFNKYLGWFVLLWYFVLGGWLAVHAYARGLEPFLRAFLWCAALVSAYGIIDFTVRMLGILDLPAGVVTFRHFGFMDNPNAFGLLLAAAAAMQMPFMAAGTLTSRKCHLLIATLILSGLILSFSRSAWFGLAIAVTAMLLMQSLPARRFALAVALATILTVSLVYLLPATLDWFSAFGLSGSAPHKSLADQIVINFVYRTHFAEDVSSLDRVAVGLRALEMWLDRPLFGTGLGSFLWTEIDRGSDTPYIIHNTLLWLLTETGLVGAAVFVGAFIVALRGLCCGLERGRPATRTLQLGMLGMIAVFVGASLGMEVTYQRYFWFLLGGALAVPAAAGPISVRVQHIGKPALRV